MSTQRTLSGDDASLEPDDIAADKKSILDFSDDCDRLFKQGLASFEGADGSAVPRRLLEEMHIRFSSWASYLGVFASPKANLDRRLKRHAAYRDLVLLAVDMLRLNLVQRRRAKFP
jgi:hypothetical protein